MEVGRKRRGFFTCTKNRRGEQVTYVFLNKDLVLLRFKLGPEWAGPRRGDRLVFRVILLYCKRLRNKRHLKGRFKAYSGPRWMWGKPNELNHKRLLGHGKHKFAHSVLL